MSGQRERLAMATQSGMFRSISSSRDCFLAVALLDLLRFASVISSCGVSV